jgi:hypothetical protein
MMKIAIVAAIATMVLAGATRVLAQGSQESPEARIDAAVGRARSRGVPVALLESKVAEGRAKGVPAERIAAAVERREAALERASQALRGQPQVADADLSVAADALEMGINDAVVKAVAESAPRARRAVAIAALSALVERGTAPDAALARVRDALKKGPDALVTLGADGGGRGNSGERGGGNSGERGANGANAGDRGGNSGERGGGTASSGRGTGGSAAGRGAASPGPPESVPAPGGQPQPRKPETPNGSNGRGNGRSGR